MHEFQNWAETTLLTAKKITEISQWWLKILAKIYGVVFASGSDQKLHADVAERCGILSRKFHNAQSRY